METNSEFAVTEFPSQESTPILVRFADPETAVLVSVDPGKIVQISEEAITSAMNTILQMARRVNSTVNDIHIMERPSQVEVDFGLELDVEAGALIARSAVTTSIHVKLTWTRKDATKVAELVTPKDQSNVT